MYVYIPFNGTFFAFEEHSTFVCAASIEEYFVTF
jgi:hypothetical protein